MISKELLSEVLGIVITKIHTTNKNYVSIENILDTSLCFDTSRQSSININIHELAHKCKEWGDRIGYTIVSYISNGSGWSDLKYERNFKQVRDLSTFRSDTEPEAIFKACQWILDNKDKQ